MRSMAVTRWWRTDGGAGGFGGSEQRAVEGGAIEMPAVAVGVTQEVALRH